MEDWGRGPDADEQPPQGDGTPGLDEVFGPGGRLEAAHPGYERRRGQEWMAQAVAKALGEGRHLLVEAGTGVGKTLAYLVPAALSGLKVIVSTGTKNLQDQIIEKDLPFVVERLGLKVRAAAVKGRDNYLCLRRFRDHDRAPLLPTEAESEAYESVRAWAPETETGDRSEVTGLPEESAFWRKINARADTCTGTRCEDYQSCYLTKVRRKAAESQIVVVNHHLFFADLALREDAFGKVLPDYDAVIFDEAHLLEDVASVFFGVSCASGRLMELSEDADRLLARDSETGLRAGGASRARARGYADEPGREGDETGIRGEGGSGDRTSTGRRRSVARRRRKESEFGPEAAELRTAAAELFGPITIPASRRSPRGPEWGEGLATRAERLRRALDRIRAASERIAPITDDSIALERRAREASAQIEFLCGGEDERYVYWAEARGTSVILFAAPVDVSDLLAGSLFSQVGSAVLTSATLSVGGSFSFVRERLGVGEAREKLVPSPFDYGRQAVLYLPSSMPEPKQPGYADRMLREIESLLEISRGRAFVLFTSHAELRRVGKALRERARFDVLAQGEMPRPRLLEEFRRRERAVLLGAASFWQGVDVAGEALSLVIIDRIPFDAPNDPLVAARIARIRALDGEPFEQYQLPAAAIELKQGLGRLIRNRSDRGILAILDARLRTRRYGKVLLESIPPFAVVGDLEQVRRFFEAAAAGRRRGAGPERRSAPAPDTPLEGTDPVG